MSVNPTSWTMSGGVWTPSGSIYEGSQDSRYRLNRPELNAEMAQLVTREKHRAMVSDARWIYTSFPIVSGCVRQKASYVGASNFDLNYTGADVEWGRKAERLLKSANKMCDVRGPMFNWSKNWWIGCCLWDIDGDWFILLTEDANGFPKFQFLESYRVGNRWGNHRMFVRDPRNGGQIVNQGEFEGARILNGIVYDDQGAPIGYNVLGSRPENDKIYQAKDVMHVANPSWFSEGRPFPTIAYSVLDLYDVKETRNFEKIAQKMNSAIAVLEKNASGKRNINDLPSPTDGSAASTSAQGFTVENFEGGMIRYLKSGTGELSAHESRRPGDGWLKFDRTILAGALYGMDWRLEMFDLSLLSGAPVRGFQDNINQTIRNRWGDLKHYMIAANLWRLSKFIERGDLEESADWDQWEAVPPREMTVDYKNSSQTYRDNIRAGIDNRWDATQRLHGDPEQSLRSEARWIKTRNEIAKEFDLKPTELGTLSQPGDPSPPESAATSDKTQTELDNE